jgi:methylated-DNA-[protein]-cysteine S-methyltransferase
MMGQYHFAFFGSREGVGAVVASERGVCEVMLPCDGTSETEVAADIVGRYPGAVPGEGYARTAAGELAAYFRGEQVAFTAPLDTAHLGSFARKVCRLVAGIGYGEVCSYGQVAAAVGSPHAARAVGAVMAANRLPIIIPCHRVVAADGAMRGYSAAGGIATKRQLLQMEGVTVDKSGRAARHQ